MRARQHGAGKDIRQGLVWTRRILGDGGWKIGTSHILAQPGIVQYQAMTRAVDEGKNGGPTGLDTLTVNV